MANIWLLGFRGVLKNPQEPPPPVTGLPWTSVTMTSHNFQKTVDNIIQTMIDFGVVSGGTTPGRARSNDLSGWYTALAPPCVLRIFWWKKVHPVYLAGGFSDLEMTLLLYWAGAATGSAQANSAFHPSGVGKWVPASAGKAKAGMVHSVSGWMRGVHSAGKTVRSLEYACHTWAP